VFGQVPGRLRRVPLELHDAMIRLPSSLRSRFLAQARRESPNVRGERPRRAHASQRSAPARSATPRRVDTELVPDRAL
jgi:hypothetical protein